LDNKELILVRTNPNEKFLSQGKFLCIATKTFKYPLTHTYVCVLERVDVMIGGKWFSKPDDDREPWCFIVLRLNSSGEDRGKIVIGWQAGYGNPRKITRILNGDGSDERETVEKLLAEIQSCRRRGVTLITLDAEFLPALRTRALLLGLKGCGLQAVRHLCVKELLKEYFLGIEPKDLSDARAILKLIDADAEVDDLQEVQVLWKLFSAIGPLLPKSCFRGSKNSGVGS
jgi:hypothetical protein